MLLLSIGSTVFGESRRLGRLPELRMMMKRWGLRAAPGISLPDRGGRGTSVTPRLDAPPKMAFRVLIEATARHANGLCFVP